MVRLAGSSGARQRQELHRHGLAGSRATMPLMDQEVFGTMSAPPHVELCATLLSSLKLLHVKLHFVCTRWCVVHVCAWTLVATDTFIIRLCVQIKDNLLIDVMAGVSIGFMVIPQGNTPITASRMRMHVHVSQLVHRTDPALIKGQWHCYQESWMQACLMLCWQVCLPCTDCTQHLFHA